MDNPKALDILDTIPKPPPQTHKKKPKTKQIKKKTNKKPPIKSHT
jgi:hypothetical protein